MKTLIGVIEWLNSDLNKEKSKGGNNLIKCSGTTGPDKVENSYLSMQIEDTVVKTVIFLRN